MNIPISKQLSIARAWKRTFWTMYDHLGLLIGLNLLWLVMSMTILLIPCATAALFIIARLLISGKSAGIKDFFRAAYKYSFKSTLIAFLFLLAFVFFAFNIRFYLAGRGLLGIILAGMNFWILFICCLMSLYTYSLLILDKKLSSALRYSFLLTIKHIGFTSRLFLVFLLLCLVAAAIPIIGISLLPVFLQNCFCELQAFYQPDLETGKLNRSLKELWRPWEFC